MLLKNLLKIKKEFFKFFKIVILVSLVAFSVLFVYENNNQNLQIASLKQKEFSLQSKLKDAEKEYILLKNEDQYVINQTNKKEIENIQKSYKNAVSSYEKLVDFKLISKNTSKIDEMFAEALSFLSQKNYASAEAVIAKINTQIDTEKAKIAPPSNTSIANDASVPSNNAPPASGYSRQKVTTEIGSFVVSIISADLNSTKVIVDTASDSTCTNDCPVLSLGDYVSRSGAYAGINGSYFCPASYPSCAGKTNSFDTLLMNKNKVYFNSDNNVYSTVPAVIFGGGWVRFVGRSLDWGRDTGVDGVIANQPLLVSGGNIVFGGDGDPKKGSKGTRSFVANKGNTVYIGVAYNVTVAENAYVMKAMGMDNALNLDSGGSTALWYQGYKAGPGRNIPNAILFVRK